MEPDEPVKGFVSGFSAWSGYSATMKRLLVCLALIFALAPSLAGAGSGNGNAGGNSNGNAYGHDNGNNGNGNGNGHSHFGEPFEPQPGVVTVDVLNRLVKENPSNMTQAIRDWMNKGRNPDN